MIIATTRRAYSGTPGGFLPMGALGETAQQINSIVTTGAEATVSIMAALHTVILGTAMAGPVGIAIGAAIAVASLVANMFHGCGSSCVIASQDANKFEVPLQQNLQAYMAAPVHFRSLQQGFLNNVDTLFNALRTACSDPSLGDPGRRCISERLDASACHWKNDGHGGAAGSGDVCWNWVVGYRDPIANDPNVVDDPPAGSVIDPATGKIISTGDGSGSSGSGFKLADWLLPAGLVLAAVIL